MEQDSANAAGDVKKKAPGFWSQGLKESMQNPELKVEEDDTIVIIKDKYPKVGLLLDLLGQWCPTFFMPWATRKFCKKSKAAPENSRLSCLSCNKRLRKLMRPILKN